MSTAAHYMDKANRCREWAAKALNTEERQDWLKLAGEWERLAIDATPSGPLPWKVQAVADDLSGQLPWKVEADADDLSGHLPWKVEVAE